MSDESQAKSKQTIVTYIMDESGNRKGEHEKLDEYLLEDYRVIDIITNVIPRGGAGTLGSPLLCVESYVRN